MTNFSKKIFGWFLVSIALLGITILGIQTFLMWENNGFNRTRLEIEHVGSLEENKKKQAEKDKLDKEHKEAQIKATYGWQAQNSDYNFQKSPEIKKCFGVEGIDRPRVFENRRLFWSPEITNFFKDILQDLEELTKTGIVNPENDEKDDGEHEHFKRRNMVMYGSPGTGKTEFIKQLARVLQERYSTWINNNIDPSNPNYELLKEIEHKVPPIIQIDGTNVKSPGKGSPVGDKIDSYEKIIAIIKKAKEAYYGDPYSDKPYIVFIEEADQGVNVLDKEKGKLLEDWKNWLSTPRDSEQLKGGAQDYNSCIIIATNNYENIDPAMFRRGRLGKKLNFNWEQNLLKSYLQYWYKNDEKLKELNFSLPKSESWQWETNQEQQQLYKMCTKIGFDVAKSELAPHLPKIIKSWTNLTDQERKVKENELGTRKNEDDKEVCNWLLHYLYTFHDYNGRRQLHWFKNAKEIQRYDYGHDYRMEELQKEHIIQICNNIMALKDALAKGISEVRGQLASDHSQFNNLQQEILIARKEIKHVQNDITDIQTSVNSSIQTNNSNSSNFSSEIASLQSQINSIVKTVGSIGTSVSSGSTNAEQAVQKYNNLSQVVSRFTSELKGCIESSNDVDKVRKIVNDFINKLRNT